MGNPRESNREFAFTFSTAAGLLTLVGKDGNGIRVKLRRLDEAQFALLDPGFHWIDEDSVLVMDEERVCDRVRPPEEVLSIWR
jgi:hypothetical protein